VKNSVTESVTFHLIK